MSITIPSAYQTGYKKVSEISPGLAEKYIQHTLIGDPTAEAVIDQLFYSPEVSGQAAAYRFIKDALDHHDETTLLAVPPLLREFIRELETPPIWVDFSAFKPGIRMFHRNSRLILAGTLGASLIEGFSTNMSKAFFITGRWRDQGERRLRQNIRHTIELFMPGGLETGGDGWSLSIRTRLVHARIRRLLSESDDWDSESWGIPLHSAHMCLAAVAFSARLLGHIKKLGALYTDEEYESYIAVWRYAGYLLGIPETILFHDGEEALKLFDIGCLCEPEPEEEAIASANGVINSGPLLLGKNDPAIRRQFAKYIYRYSRALIGNTLADKLKFPLSATFGVLAQVRMQERYYRFLTKLCPKYSPKTKFANFTALLNFAMFDEAGISYRMPDHVYSEESNKW